MAYRRSGPAIDAGCEVSDAVSPPAAWQFDMLQRASAQKSLLEPFSDTTERCDDSSASMNASGYLLPSLDREGHKGKQFVQVTALTCPAASYIGSAGFDVF
ncbi:hypothetical protein [Rhizobium sp. 18055]|uniref:hypothetical protein n=1 Tax=Rhizobium sp. 18055 TaxID=2681403 RepID=UPI001357A2D4|nr:hypothetical protein [Rhizobium sp. 18055]